MVLQFLWTHGSRGNDDRTTASWSAPRHLALSQHVELNRSGARTCLYDLSASAICGDTSGDVDDEACGVGSDMKR